MNEGRDEGNERNRKGTGKKGKRKEQMKEGNWGEGCSGDRKGGSEEVKGRKKERKGRRE